MILHRLVKVDETDDFKIWRKFEEGMSGYSGGDPSEGPKGSVN